MPLSAYDFPLRLPEERLAKSYRSVEDAFSSHDFLFVARYGKASPELHGSALLMLGNRTGGQRVLDAHNIRTPRSFLYRAFSAWQVGRAAEATQWLREAKKLSEATGAVERFEQLMLRKNFRVVVHSDFRDPRVQVLPNLNLMAGLANSGDVKIEVIVTSHFDEKDSLRLPLGGDISDFLPAGSPIDLILLHDVRLFPIELARLGAPVVLTTHDLEWHNVLFDKALPYVDWMGVCSSSDAVEIAGAFQKKSFINCYSFFMMPSFNLRGLAARFAEPSQRPIDLVFTGGMTHDYYRDKRQRILSLGHCIDPSFKLKLYEGHLPMHRYIETLRASRFTPISVRTSNYWSNRCAEALAAGVVNLVDHECGFPHLFSEPFACFQSYRNESATADIEGHLRRYDEIRGAFVPQAPRLEDEICDIFPDAQERAMRYMRLLLFMTIVEQNGERRIERPKDQNRSIPYDFSRGAPYFLNDEVARTITETRSTEEIDRPSHWLQSALSQTTEPLKEVGMALQIISQGLKAHPRSLALHYAHGLLLQGDGQFSAADDAFRLIIESDDLMLAPDDPFPIPWDPLHASYWIEDARIRTRSGSVVPLVPEAMVWKSFAWSHRAYRAMARLSYYSGASDKGGICPDERADRLMEVVGYARQALQLFVYNDASQRIYLRAAYGLYALGDESWGDDFLKSFAVAKNHDGRIFHDFAIMVVDILTRRGNEEEAAKVKAQLILFLNRVQLRRGLLFLYPEVHELAVRYNLPHGMFSRL